MWKFWSFFSLKKLDSLMHLKHIFFLHCEESQNAFTCPFCGSQNEGPASFKWRSGGAGLLQMDQLWGYSSKGRNWGFSTWVKIVLFLCKICFRTQMFIFLGPTHNQKSHKADRFWDFLLGGGRVQCAKIANFGSSRHTWYFRLSVGIWMSMC